MGGGDLFYTAAVSYSGYCHVIYTRVRIFIFLIVEGDFDFEHKHHHLLLESLLISPVPRLTAFED